MPNDEIDAKARALVRGPNVGAGDGDTYIPRTPSVQELAGALREARESALRQAADAVDHEGEGMSDFRIMTMEELT